MLSQGVFPCHGHLWFSQPGSNWTNIWISVKLYIHCNVLHEGVVQDLLRALSHLLVITGRSSGLLFFPEEASTSIICVGVDNLESTVCRKKKKKHALLVKMF